MNTSDLLTPGLEYSEAFAIPNCGALVLNAYGLQAGDAVRVERIDVSRGGPQGGVCCPGPVSLPEVQSSLPLMCGPGKLLELTVNAPWVELTDPRGALLRLRLVSPNVDLSQVIVTMTEVCRSGGCGCA